MTCVRTVFRDAIARLRVYVPGWRDNMAAAARSASSVSPWAGDLLLALGHRFSASSVHYGMVPRTPTAF